MKLRTAFYGAVMNKDLDVRAIPKNQALHFENIRMISPDGSNASAVRMALGNTQLSSFSFGANAKWVGHSVDDFANIIRWGVKSDTGNYVVEYNTLTNASAVIMTDTRAGASNVLNFQDDEIVEMSFINDTLNGRSFLFMTDNNSEPKYFNIERMKGFAANAFVEEDITLIKKPPLEAPTITLGNTATSEENNLERKFVSFAYRYKYLDGEYSALSAFSEFAFMAKGFSYDYATSTNDAMFNLFSKADIGINTGSSRVSEIEIIFKESISNTAYIVEKISKDDKGWADNTVQTVEFSNNKIYQVLPADQLSRYYDNVPLWAKSIEVIGNRVVFGNYTENYNLVDGVGAFIYPSLTLDYVASAGTEGLAYTTAKTNRDYEIAIGYLDGKGRITTPITSVGNTTYIQNSDADKENKLRVTIDSKAPAFATHYKFFIKQSKTQYDVLSPVQFYVDGVYVWLKIEGGDQNKIEEGDFLYVKSDTSGLRTGRPLKVKVLEVTVQGRNFLDTTDAFELLQEAGTYFKIKREGTSLDPDAVRIYNYSSKGFRTGATDNNMLDQVDYIEAPVYYGTVGSNDLSSSGTYTGADDIRYEVEMVTTGGATDSFKWREIDVTENATSPVVGLWNDNAGLGFDCTGAAQALSNGVNITFGEALNHQSDDAWVVSAKSLDVSAATNESEASGSAGTVRRRALIPYKGKSISSEGDEAISGGATITITYDDTPSDAANVFGFFELSFVSSKTYANIEEWYYGDAIYTQLIANGYPTRIDYVLFRRGSVEKVDNEQVRVNPTGDMIMIIVASPNFSGGSKSIAYGDLRIEELDNNIIFETVPVDVNSELFYELPETYEIIGDNHRGKVGDTNQIFGSVNAVINLPYFNAFGWANGFESYKIGDSFNAKEMILDTKPIAPITDYKQITRQASLTYGGIYERTTSYNALNEFNLSLANYKDMDDSYGSIQKLFSLDTDLFTFQENKTHRVLFEKDMLFNADGTTNIVKSSTVLGQEIPRSGKYGIGLHPESFAYYGNSFYHLDTDSGALVRHAGDGYTEISKDGFHDYFRTLSPKTMFQGGYNPYDDVYMLNTVDTGTANTIAYSEGANGFAGFYSFVPEAMMNINNRMYSIKNGQLWLHDDDNGVRGRFYGVEYDAKVVTVLNDLPNDIKVFKNLNIEGNMPWDIEVETNMTSGTIDATQFVEQESEWNAYIRQNEAVNDTQSISALQGLGEVGSTTATTITMDAAYLNESLAEGDVVLKYVSDNNLTVVGTVQSVDTVTKIITLDSVAGGTVNGDFLMLQKDMRSESSDMRGYFMKITLTTNERGGIELFAINSAITKNSE